MAYKIAAWEWQDINGEPYLVELYSKTTNITQIDYDGVTSAILSNDSNNEDYFDFIVSTKFDLSFLIYNVTEYNVIGTILTVPENDIYCKFMKADGEIIFKGYILPELITIENAPYPYEVTLSFSDSIGKMKDIKYEISDFGTTPYYYAINAINFFVKALQKLDIDDLYINNTDYFLNTKPGYFYEGWATGDPYYKITLNLAVFTNNYENTVYDSLLEFCRLFHSRIIFSKGVYIIENIDIRLNATNKTFAYKNWATYAIPVYIPTATNNAIEIDHSSLKIYNGSTISFLPALSQVDLKFEIEDLDRISAIAPYKWDWDNLSSQESINTIVLVDNTKLHFEFEYYFQYGSGGATDYGRVWIKMEFVIKCGDYYLKRDIVSYNLGEVVYSAVEWTLTPSSYYFYTDPWIWESGNSMKWANNFLFIIDTPVIPESGELSILVQYVEIDVSEVEGEFETEITHLQYVNVYNYMRVEGNQNEDLKTIIYTAINSVLNFKKLEFEGVHLDFGDCNLPQQPYIDGVGLPTGWDIDGGSDYIPIQNLFIKSVLQLRESIRKVQNLNLRWHDYSVIPFIYNLITYDSVDYMIISATYDFRHAEGTFVAVQLVKGVITFEVTNVSTKINKFSATSDSTTMANQTTGGGKDNILPVVFIELTADRAIQSTPTLPINAMIGDYYEGDFFRIYAIQERAYDILMLTEDIKDKDTSINSALGQLTRAYQKYSRIVMDQRPGRINQTISNPTTTGSITGTKLLPDPTKLSLAALRRKVQVENQGVVMKLVLENDLENYNDFAIGSTLDYIMFFEDQTGNHITINFESWEDILPT